MTSQNVWNMSLFEHFFKGLSLYWEARIRIRIRVKSRIRFRIKVMRIHNIGITVLCTRCPLLAAGTWEWDAIQNSPLAGDTKFFFSLITQAKKYAYACTENIDLIL
jgi:hypothetical protein